jgi:PST family polysaccharide transporter
LNKKKLFSDTFFYASIQASNFALPLITLPYITRVVGVEKFGFIELALIFVNFFVLLIKYGFDYTATRDIARNHKDLKKVCVTFSDYMVAKTFILLIAVIVFVLCLFHVESIEGLELIYILTFIGVLADYLLPTWLFRGMGDIRTVAIVNFFAKLLFLPLVFIFITEEEDYFYRPLMMSLSSVLLAIFGLVYAFKKYKLKIIGVRCCMSLQLIYSSLPMYVSSCLIFLSGAFNIIIIDNYTSISQFEIGNFTAASKIIQIIQNVIVLSISQVFYPYFISSFAKDRSKFGELILITFILQIFFGLIIAAVLYFLSDSLVVLVFGEKFTTAADYLKLMAFLPMLSLLANLFLIQALASMGRDVLVMSVNIAMFVLNVCTVVWCYNEWLVEGVIYQRILIQTLVISLSVILFLKVYKSSNKRVL